MRQPDIVPATLSWTHHCRLKGTPGGESQGAEDPTPLILHHRVIMINHTRTNYDSDHWDWLKKAERPGISAKPLDKRVRERPSRDCATALSCLCSKPLSVATPMWQLC